MSETTTSYKSASFSSDKYTLHCPHYDNVINNIGTTFGCYLTKNDNEERRAKVYNCKPNTENDGLHKKCTINYRPTDAEYFEHNSQIIPPPLVLTIDKKLVTFEFEKEKVDYFSKAK